LLKRSTKTEVYISTASLLARRRTISKINSNLISLTPLGRSTMASMKDAGLTRRCLPIAIRMATTSPPSPGNTSRPSTKPERLRDQLLVR